jgi:hypothetical protein
MYHISNAISLYIKNKALAIGAGNIFSDFEGWRREKSMEKGFYEHTTVEFISSRNAISGSLVL